MFNYGYNGYTNPYSRNYNMQNYGQQYPMQNQQVAQQQTTQMQNQQPMQYEMPFSYIGFGNLKEVEGHILFPNQKALFIDSANGMIYEKMSNIDGQSCIKHYKQVVKPEEKSVDTAKEQPTIDLSSYVKKDDLGQFVSLKQHNELLSKFETLQKQVMGVKPNVATSK